MATETAASQFTSIIFGRAFPFKGDVMCPGSVSPSGVFLAFVFPFCCASVSKLSTQIDDVNNDDTKIDLLHDWQTSFVGRQSEKRTEPSRNLANCGTERALRAAGHCGQQQQQQNKNENENGNENGNWLKGMGIDMAQKKRVGVELSQSYFIFRAKWL